MRPANLAVVGVIGCVIWASAALAGPEKVRNTLGTLVVNRTGATLSNLPTFSQRDEENQQAAAAAFSADMSTLRDAAAMQGAGGVAAFHGAAATGAVDFWVGGSYTYYDAGLGGVASNGGIGAAQAGVDLRANDWLLVGVMVMGDMLSGDVTSGVTIDTDAIGFLAGPYVVVALADNVHFEALAAGGMVFNEYTMHSAIERSADYRSDRLLATARISADLRQDNFTIIPSLRGTFYGERQNGFTDRVADGSPGTAFDDDTSAIVQLRAGSEFGYDIALESGGVRPFVGAELVWAVYQDEQLMNNVLVTPNAASGSATVGFDAYFESGVSMRLSGRVDGLGNEEFDGATGDLQVRVPFN